MTISLTRRIIPAMAVVSWLAAGMGAGAQDTVGEDTFARAKDLYVRAAYDEALAVLERLHESASADEATEIAGYQVFCLLALGRTDEAHRAIEAIVEADPLYRPSESTASPRTRAVFDDVRRGLLPGIAKQTYDKAKAAFDRNEPKAAVAEFDRVLVLLKEPELSDLPVMADLRRLAVGFRDLSVAAVEAASAAPGSEPDPAPAVPPPPPIYSPTDANVVPPTSVSRETPPWRPRNSLEARQEYDGLLELVIDEQGGVASAVLNESVHPAYDRDLLQSARAWKFQPATKDGTPVRYRITMAIRLRPSGT